MVGHCVKTQFSLPEEPLRREDCFEPDEGLPGGLQQHPSCPFNWAAQWEAIAATPLLQSQVPPVSTHACSDRQAVPAGQVCVEDAERDEFVPGEEGLLPPEELLPADEACELAEEATPQEPRLVPPVGLLHTLLQQSAPVVQLAPSQG